MYQQINTKETVNGVEMWRINNDINGNGRYVVHYLSISDSYELAVKISREFGGRVYTAKWFGGGIVFKTQCTSQLSARIKEASNYQEWCKIVLNESELKKQNKGLTQ
jgi:hypothetical protein